MTGGGALLNHIDKLTEYHTGISCRIGVPIEHLAHGYSERLSSPIYSTAVGLLLKGIADVEAGAIKYQEKEELVDTREEEHTEEEVLQEEKGSWLDGIFRKTKEWFEAEPDSEF